MNSIKFVRVTNYDYESQIKKFLNQGAFPPSTDDVGYTSEADAVRAFLALYDEALSDESDIDPWSVYRRRLEEEDDFAVALSQYVQSLLSAQAIPNHNLRGFIPELRRLLLVADAVRDL